MSAPELKPCPFCGGEALARRREEPNGDAYAVVECADCYAETPIAMAWHEKIEDCLPEAIKVWNTRADLCDPARDARVRALVDALHGEATHRLSGHPHRPDMPKVYAALRALEQGEG